MINFVVSDLETALVPNGEKMVQEETIELIMELKEKGVYFAVATGRNYDAVYPMFGKAKDHIVYICNCLLYTSKKTELRLLFPI